MATASSAIGLMRPHHVDQFKGLFGEELVDLIAASAGLISCRPTLDLDGIDRNLTIPGELGDDRPPVIQIQVKTTVSATVHRDDCWHHWLKASHFNLLAGGRQYTVPRYLALVPVEENHERWLRKVTLRGDHREWLLSAPVYWVNLMHREPVEGSGITVAVPQSNLLTPASIADLFDYSQLLGE